MDQEKKQVNIVHERDLDKLLDRFGLNPKLVAGELKCKFCKDVITKDGLYSLLPEAGTVNVVCDKPSCVIQFLEYLDDKKRTKLEQ